MRVWPYQMLRILPTKQLLSQWRECMAISGMIASGKDIYSMDGINHATINRIKEYTLEEFMLYCDLVIDAFNKREFKIGTNTIEKLEKDIYYSPQIEKAEIEEVDTKYGKIIKSIKLNGKPLWENFHNERYLKQCLYMFQEKEDVDILYDNEWEKLESAFDYLL